MGKFIKFVILTAAVVLLFLTFCSGPAAPKGIPPAPSALTPVVDRTETLSDDEIKEISETIGNKPDQEDYPQIAVFMRAGKHLSTIEETALEVARDWGIGSSGNKDGVLLYVAKSLREMRIEVADGSGVLLTDSEASQIIRNIIVPHFENDDYAEGINAGVAAIRAELNGEVGALSDEVDEASSSLNKGLVATIIVSAVLLLFFYIIPFLFFRGKRSSNPNGSRRSSSSSDDDWHRRSSSSSSDSSSFGGGGGFSGGGSSGRW